LIQVRGGKRGKKKGKNDHKKKFPWITPCGQGRGEWSYYDTIGGGGGKKEKARRGKRARSLKSGEAGSREKGKQWGNECFSVITQSRGEKALHSVAGGRGKKKGKGDKGCSPTQHEKTVFLLIWTPRERGYVSKGPK